MYAHVCACVIVAVSVCVCVNICVSLMSGIFLSFSPLSMWMPGAEHGFFSRATSALTY